MLNFGTVWTESVGSVCGKVNDKMKQKKTFKGQKPFGRKLATMLGAVAFCLTAVCTIAIYGITAKVEVAPNRETKAAVTTTNMISTFSMENQNAGVIGKRFVEKTKTVKETTVSKKKEANKTTSKKTKQTKASVVKKTTKSTTKKAVKENVETTKSYGTISYTNDEYEMLCYVLQHEVGSMSENSKIAVANVIINRVKSGNFPGTLEGVLTSPNQFTAIRNYYNKTDAPTQSIKDCALRALNGENNIGNAVYYYAPKYCGGSTAQWFENLTFCAELEGQRFFC